MTNRTWFSLILLALVAGVAIYVHLDWLRPPPIQITPTIRPGQRSRLNPDVYPVSFMLDGKYELTEIKVVAVDDIKTNKYPHALWHMISDSHSKPTKIIVYGMPIPGMKPSVPRGRPEPLQPNVPYRLIVKAGKSQGQADFKTMEVVLPTSPDPPPPR